MSVQRVIKRFIKGPLLSCLGRGGGVEFAKIGILGSAVTDLFTKLASGDCSTCVNLVMKANAGVTAFVPSSGVAGLSPRYRMRNLVPIGLRSKGFCPPFLATISSAISTASSDLNGRHFRGTMSNVCLKSVLGTTFPLRRFRRGFSTEGLATVVGCPSVRGSVCIRMTR